MSKRTDVNHHVDFNTVAEARAFAEGVEYINDSSIRVEHRLMRVWIFDEGGEKDEEEIEETMKEWRVTWEIDVSATSPREAAIEAERVQHDQINETNGAMRGVFSVAGETVDGGFAGALEIDLSREDRS